MDDASTTVLVDVSDLDGRDDGEINIEEFLMIPMPTKTGPTTLKPEEDNALRQAVAESWLSKAYADVEVLCGVDGGVVLTHRIILAALSPYLRMVLRADPVACQHETSCLVLPDVDSAILSNFLARACLGGNEVAVTNPSLAFLKFRQRPARSTKVKEKGKEDEPEDEEFNEQFIRENLISDDDEEEREISKAAKPKKKKSMVWKFFAKIDSVTAKCRACNFLAKIGNGNTTGMGRHLRRFHQDLYQAFNLSFGLGNVRLTDRPKRKIKTRSIVWNYFIKQDNSSALCTLCDKMVGTGASNTSGMVRHLKRYHQDAVVGSNLVAQEMYDNDNESDWPVVDPSSLEVKVEDSFAVTDPFDIEVPSQTAKDTSKVWNYFNKQGKSEAVCLNCNETVKSEGGNVSVMNRHLKCHHPAIWDKCNNDDNDNVEIFGDVTNDVPDQNDEIYEEDPMKGRCRSLVWNYFAREDKYNAVCSLCNANVKTGGGNTSGMARHLRRAHQEEYAEFREASKISLETEAKVKEIKKLATPRIPKATVTVKSMPTIEVDPLKDVWKFFDHVESNNRQDEQVDEISEANSAICKFCQTEVDFDLEDMSALVHHLQAEHQSAIEAYATSSMDPSDTETVIISADNIDIKTELIDDPETALEVSRRSTRSAIWNYFNKTEDKTKNVCVMCEKVMLCSSQNTTSMIRHLGRHHQEQFALFLQESASQQEQIRKNFTMTKKKKKQPKDEATELNERTCPDCLKVYWHKRAMLYHKKIVHSGERPYQCMECHVTFARLDCFRNHTHNPDKKYLCSQCGKTFGRKSARDLHERAHRGDKRYSCTHCGKMFMTNQALHKHEMIHTGEKPFQCKECGKQFTQMHQLTTHMRIHTGEKPYSCDFCDLRFRHLSSKSKHKCEGRHIAVKWVHQPSQVLVHEENSMEEDSD